ncbi:MAG: hypothetical protein MMC33_000878 [Icmadophila ericetorum]|nr:hypothetical protein [Icmadophila ericetorum]
MASQSLPPAVSLQHASQSEIADVLDHLFEPSPQLHELSIESLRKESFSSYADMIDHVGSQLTKWSDLEEPDIIKRLEKILGAHPRLGEKKVDSAQSRAEQAQLQASDGSRESELRSLNAEYENAFPGLIYVVFVNGRTRTVIMQDMRARIERGDINLERKDAIQAMCDIAKNRASKALVMSA